MLLPAVLLPLAAMLQQSLGEQPQVTEINEKLQMEITEQINNLRKEVIPSASNMLKMQPQVTEINEKLQMEIIEKINNLRREVIPSASNMLKMTWSEKAAANAKKHASKCQFRNSPEEDRKLHNVTCSETLSQTETAMPWGAMIEAWASAQKYFIFGSLPADAEGSILSYTQLISYSSHEVGCALVHCPESASPYFYLCHFCPGGNIIGKLAEPYKEGPSCEACPGNCEDKLCTNP